MITQVDLGSTTLTNSKRLLQAVKNLSFPDINTSVVRRGSFAGQKLVVGKPNGYKFALEWAIIGDTFSDLATQRETFQKILSEIITAGSKTLKFNKSNSANIQVDVKSIKVTGDLESKDGTATKMLVELVSEYPYLQSQDQQSSDVFIYNGGGMSIPMALPVDMSIGGSNEANLSSSGTIEAYPIFRFYGPLTNPSLQNVTTSKTLSVNYSLTSPTDYIEIDTFNRTVNLCISGSISNGRQYISGDFWTLQVGANIIHLGNTSFNATGKCVITWRDHFIGI